MELNNLLLLFLLDELDLRSCFLIQKQRFNFYLKMLSCPTLSLSERNIQDHNQWEKPHQYELNLHNLTDIKEIRRILTISFKMTDSEAFEEPEKCNLKIVHHPKQCMKTFRMNQFAILTAENLLKKFYQIEICKTRMVRCLILISITIDIKQKYKLLIKLPQLLENLILTNFGIIKLMQERQWWKEETWDSLWEWHNTTSLK